VQAHEWRKLLSEEVAFSQKTTEEYNYYELKYNISRYQEWPFCVVVPTYNNVENDRYLRNIRSILLQNYSNYRVVIIDDHSTDGTGDLLEKFMAGQSKLAPEQYVVVRNSKKMKAMANIRKAAMDYCGG